MSDQELRRLELKSKIISSEITKLKHEGRELAIDLKRKEQRNRFIEKSWLQYLKDTVAIYRNAAPQQQSKILSSKLKTLSESRNFMSHRKREQELLQNKLDGFLLLVNQKKSQLSHCVEKRLAKLASFSEIEEQKHLDEYAALTSVKREIEKNTFPVSQKDSDIAPDFSSFADLSVPLVQMKNGPVSCLNQKEESELRQPERALTLCEQNREMQEIISYQNEPLKVSVLKTSHGDSVCLDYLLSPGRLLSMAALKSTRSSAVSLKLGASNNLDHTKLRSGKNNILSLLNNSGIAISDFEIIES